ncbi:MAG TPA: glycosyltransferase family 4 protein, partial [Candidatus Paceibacterota bacterium]|nr:glycosyltransferase family 4 protein [Candidatus Paceibacterota bacterium]
LPESGILTVIEAAKKLEGSNVDFLVIGRGFMYREVWAAMKGLAPKNVEIDEEFLPADELRRAMLSCHVSIGQVADHPRLKRTLPCKLFESLALKLPYITGKNTPLLELLTDGIDCISIEPGDAEGLANAVMRLKDDQTLREKIAEAGYEMYRNKMTSKTLAKRLLFELGYEG